MSPVSIRALLGFSFLLLALGASLGSPAAAVPALVLAAAGALPALAKGARPQRVLAALLVLLSLWLAIVQWPALRRERDAWRAHAGRSQPPAGVAVPQVPAPVPPPPGSLALPSTDPDAQPDIPAPAAPAPAASPNAP